MIEGRRTSERRHSNVGLKTAFISKTPELDARMDLEENARRDLEDKISKLSREVEILKERLAMQGTSLIQKQISDPERDSSSAGQANAGEDEGTGISNGEGDLDTTYTVEGEQPLALNLSLAQVNTEGIEAEFDDDKSQPGSELKDFRLRLCRKTLFKKDKITKPRNGLNRTLETGGRKIRPETVKMVPYQCSKYSDDGALAVSPGNKFVKDQVVSMGYKCEFCEKSYRWKTTLSRHRKTHTPVKTSWVMRLKKM
ncbi:unnamed protein product [Allacma fusca]|uniref:C2H2-type domain-containing protein n=1 Tax=Allacma fusca TaxID=39272 RepID=A0A8J2J8Z9_9HEXA|nr:unnamed protein product [Allacma fusca]